MRGCAQVKKRGDVLEKLAAMQTAGGRAASIFHMTEQLEHKKGNKQPA